MSRTVIHDAAADAVAGIADESTILVGGFGMAGMPTRLIDALIDQGAGGLTVVSNNAGNGDTGLAALLAAGRVDKVICSFPRQADSYVFDGLYQAGKVDRVVAAGELDPENVVTPGIFVDRILNLSAVQLGVAS